MLSASADIVFSAEQPWDSCEQERGAKSSVWTLPTGSAGERPPPHAKGLERMKGEKCGQLYEGEMLETAR